MASTPSRVHAALATFLLAAITLPGGAAARAPPGAGSRYRLAPASELRLPAGGWAGRSVARGAPGFGFRLTVPGSPLRAGAATRDVTPLDDGEVARAAIAASPLGAGADVAASFARPPASDADRTPRRVRGFPDGRF